MATRGVYLQPQKIWPMDRCRLGMRGDSTLTIYSHVGPHGSHARARIGNTVDHDEAVITDAHPAKDSPGSPVDGSSRRQAFQGDEDRGD